MDCASWDRKLRKWDSKGNTVMPLGLVTLGVVGETAELIEATDKDNEEVLKEAGDVLWYIRAACKRLRINFASFYQYACETGDEEFSFLSREDESETLLQRVGLLSDLVKKHEWHGKHVAKTEWIELLARITRRVHVIAEEFGGWDDDQIFSANIDKLQKRYPGGFVEGGGIR